MLDPRIIENYPFDSETIICAAYMGSVSHGTSNPDPTGIDDTDIMGAVIPPFSYLVGVDKFEQWDPVPNPDSPLGELDCTFYDLRKLVRLWLKSNPNVLGLLWLRPQDYIIRSPEFDLFVDSRLSFSSLIGVSALKGYAMGQMRDMDKGVYRGYMGAKRKELVEKFGYDTKHAAHTIRILRMGIEYCQTGEYHVWRGDRDADELKSIKRGDWPRDRVIREADKLVSDLETARHESNLPEQPDEENVRNLLLETLGRAVTTSSTVRVTGTRERGNV